MSLCDGRGTAWQRSVPECALLQTCAVCPFVRWSSGSMGQCGVHCRRHYAPSTHRWSHSNDGNAHCYQCPKCVRWRVEEAWKSHDAYMACRDTYDAHMYPYDAHTMPILEFENNISKNPRQRTDVSRTRAPLSAQMMSNFLAFSLLLGLPFCLEKLLCSPSIFKTQTAGLPSLRVSPGSILPHPCACLECVFKY